MILWFIWIGLQLAGIVLYFLKRRGFFSYCSGWILSPCQFCPLVQCAVSAKCSHSQHTAPYTRGNTSIWLLCCSAVLSMWLATLLPNKRSPCLLPVVIYSQIHPCPVHFIPKEKSFSNWTECGPWGLTLQGDQETEYFVGTAMWMKDENLRLTGLMLRCFSFHFSFSCTWQWMELMCATLRKL